MAVLLSGCQPIVLPPAPVVIPVAASEPVAIAAPIQIPEKGVVIDEAGPIAATDPVQAQAEAEFRALVIAKQEANYAGDFAKLISYYADDVISVQPGWPEIVGKAALSEGLKPYMEGNQIVGTFILKNVSIDGNHATRFGEWDEVVTPRDGGLPCIKSGAVSSLGRRSTANGRSSPRSSTTSSPPLRWSN